MRKKMVRPQFLVIVRQGGSPFPVRPVSNLLCRPAADFPRYFSQSVLSPPFLQPLRIRHKTNICSLQTPKYHVLLCL